jgi:tetratricopeptide (TPR) repeat protein
MMTAFTSEEATMNVRILTVFVAAGAALSLSNANAAISVFGGGSAQLCYEAADQHLPASHNLEFCDQALGGVLSDADRAATYVNRGVLKMTLGRYNSAKDDFDAGLAIDGSMGEGYVDRGATLVALKAYGDALGDINKGLSLGTKQPHLAYYDRAIANEGLGHLQEAYNDYHQALTIRPDFDLAINELKRFKVVPKPSGT